MTLPRYAEYRGAEEVGLDRIPLHWTIARFSRVLGGLKDGTHGTFARVAEGQPLLSAKNVLDGQLQMTDAESLISDEDHADIVANGFPRRGDLLLTIVGTIGRSCVYKFDDPLAFQRSVCFLRLMPGKSPQFFYYFTQSKYFQEQLIARSKSAAQAGVYMGDVAATTVMFPPQLGEQERIAAFLDHETAKIDGLIAEQERLIALLAEKRQATISHAVTRGLNPQAPMKDSGVPWLGGVPAHWRVGKVQTFARRESGHTPSRQRPEYWENCTVPWFTLADVHQIRDGKTDHVFETKELVSELGLANSSARLLPKGTVMLSRTASVGYAAIMGVDMATTQDFVNWVCHDDLLPEFLLFVLRGMKSEFDRLMMGSTHQTIYMPDIAKLTMAQPPVDEQRQIVEALKARLKRLDLLAADATQAVGLLRERRSALIAAAVTGQIDVRGFVPRNDAPKEAAA